MNRRRILVGAGIFGALVGGGFLVVRGVPWGNGSSEPTEDREPQPEPPFEIRTIEAQGSQEGSVTVPDPEWLTVLNFTRTACPTSEGYLENLAAAREDVDDGRVRFVSVLEYGRDPTDTDEAFADWWAEHDGEWTLGIDDDGALVEYYDGSNTPATVLVGGDGTVHWEQGGTPRPSEIVAEVESALEASEGG